MSLSEKPDFIESHKLPQALGPSIDDNKKLYVGDGVLTKVVIFELIC